MTEIDALRLKLFEYEYRRYTELPFVVNDIDELMKKLNWNLSEIIFRKSRKVPARYPVLVFSRWYVDDGEEYGMQYSGWEYDYVYDSDVIAGFEVYKDIQNV